MARKFLTNIDMNGNQIVTVLAEVLAADPGSPAEGRYWYDSTNKTFKFRTNTATISLGRLDQISAPTTTVSMNSQRIINLADPSGAQDAATKNYVDATVLGLDFKGSVRAATTGNIASFSSAPNTIDGVSLAANDRILVKDQSTASLNGIYRVVTVGTGADGSWARATDFDSSAEASPGSVVIVEEGSTHADTMWIMSTNGPITLNTTSLTFTKIGPAAGGALAKFTTATHASATAVTITHNLGTKNVVVSVRQVSDDVEVYPEIDMDTVNTIIARFAVAPTANTLNFTVIG